MFREELISAHHQKEIEAAAEAEREVCEDIGHVFGTKWIARVEINGRNVKIEDIELFDDRYSDLYANCFLLLGQCPRCGEKCWSRPCFSAAAVGEQLVNFQASLTRHTCAGLRQFLRYMFRC